VAAVAMLAALGLAVVAAVSDSWFIVEGKDLAVPDEMRAARYHFGLWMKCYEDPPHSIPQDELVTAVLGSGDRCVGIYSDLTSPPETQSALVTRLSRACVLLLAVFVVAQLSVLLALLCCCCPGGHVHYRKACVACLAAGVQLLASCAGVGSAICFLAARESQQGSGVYARAATAWGWGYVLMWAAAGMAVVANFLLAFLVKYAPEYSDASKLDQYYYSHNKLGEVVKAYWTEDGPVY